MTFLHVALLRGIGPADPATRNDRLRSAFTSMGFTGVRTVISSGNVVFEVEGDPDVAQLEARIEQGLAEHVGAADRDDRAVPRAAAGARRPRPLRGRAQEPGTVLNVTFLKQAPAVDLDYPHRPEGRSYTLLALHDLAICSVVRSAGSGTADLMTWLERRLGKQITTRTYRTVGRILAAMDAP